jgi:ubiquinone/menaquinone biosynthesis C-methylase UbiE
MPSPEMMPDCKMARKTMNGTQSAHNTRPEAVSENLPDDFYDRIKPRLHRRVGRELRLARHVLDLGCGSCELVRYLAGRYGQQITGVDISSDSFPGSRQRRKGPLFYCRRADARHLHFAQARSIDAAILFWSLHEMSSPAAVFREIRRILRPGGKVLIAEFPEASLAARLWNEAYFRPDEIQAFLNKAGFKETAVRLIEKKQIIWARAFQPPAANNNSKTDRFNGAAAQGYQEKPLS